MSLNSAHTLATCLISGFHVNFHSLIESLQILVAKLFGNENLKDFLVVTSVSTAGGVAFRCSLI